MKFLLPTFFLLAWAVPLAARPASHDAVVSVLGQASPTDAEELFTPTRRSLYNPEGVAVDPVTGKVFVADRDNHRILRFSATEAYQTHAEAEAVFGQADFTSGQANRGNPSPSADSLSAPACLWIDPEGRLWVADSGNARVLRFDGASSKPSGTAAADGVIGQPDFSSNTPALNSTLDAGFAEPVGLTGDDEGRIWVSDLAIPRILRFDNAATLSGDAAASGWFGETEGDMPVDPADFDSETISASSFGAEGGGLSLDVDGNLWAADPSRNRVLCFFDAANRSNGDGADLVLGQDDFVGDELADPPTADRFNTPYYVTAAPDGTVWVSDFLNFRVLGFLDAANLDDGAEADIVLGQPDFDSNTPPASYTAQTLQSPAQIAIGREGSLLVAEYAGAGRIARYSDPVLLLAPRQARTARSGVAIFRGSSLGANRVEYRVAGQAKFRPARGAPASWNVRVARLQRRFTQVAVRAIAFDGRVAVARVKVIKTR